MKTSYFAKSGSNGNAVSITAFAPSWFHGRHYPKLAPHWSLVSRFKKKEINEDEYRLEYQKQILDKLDPKQVIEELGDNVILLCYEKSGSFCHRRIVAAWIEKHTGIVIDEVER